MISAFTVYLVMQADAIVVAAGLSGSLLGVFGVMFWTFASDYDDEKNVIVASRLTYAGVFLILFAALFPSTKTAAAMLIVPAITSGEVVEMATPEARELYDLAKGALESFGADKCPKESGE